MNDQFIKHVGYTNTNDAIASYFSSSTVYFISNKITTLLRDIYPAGIIVPCDKIINVMNDIYESYRPSTGDIYTRYAIPSDENPNYVNAMINQVIQVIVSHVKNTLLTEQRNSKLDIWSSLYGTFNAHGLRQHAPIKTLKKRSKRLFFSMNY